MGVSPARPSIQELDSWQIGLIFELAMKYPIEGVRQAYYKEEKKSLDEFEDSDLLEAGYSRKELMGDE